eukprot:1010905_1
MTIFAISSIILISALSGSVRVNSKPRVRSLLISRKKYDSIVTGDPYFPLQIEKAGTVVTVDIAMIPDDETPYMPGKYQINQLYADLIKRGYIKKGDQLKFESATLSDADTATLASRNIKPESRLRVIS